VTAEGTRQVEVELKYRVAELAAAERLLAADHVGPFSVSGGRQRSLQLEDRYVDTADGALGRAGFAVRLRRSGDKTMVSVKSLARTDGPGGSVRREELEGPADRIAAPVDWPPSDARSLVLEHAGDAPLVELVTVRQLRRKRLLKSGQSRVELSLDEVDVVSRGRIVDRFVELEAELQKGDETELEALGAALDAEPTLRRAQTSKLEAALAAVDGATGDEPEAGEFSFERVPAAPATTAAPIAQTDRPAPRLVVGRTPGVTAEDHIAEAGRKVMRFHLARMLEYEPGVRAGIDNEAVHKMRVATRRQRAAWRVFGEAFRKRRTKRYRDGLRETAGRLGAVRDLDVQLEAADAYRADLPVAEQRGLEPLLTAWRQHRDDARVLLLRDLDSPAFRRWVDDYVDFVRTEGAAVVPVGPVEPHRVRDTAPSRVWAAYEGVRGYESVLRWADVPTLHELRIAGKWLRYSVEFVREALGTDADTLIARVTALQDHLGLMNDADVTASMTRTFLLEHAADLSAPETAAIGRYLVDREKEVTRLRRTIGPTWRGVAGVQFRRTLGRVVAGL
jgi:CHAD domain-containing protein